MAAPVVLNAAAAANAQCKAEIARVRLLDTLVYNDGRTDWREHLLARLHPHAVLDVESPPAPGSNRFAPR